MGCFPASHSGFATACTFQLFGHPTVTQFVAHVASISWPMLNPLEMAKWAWLRTIDMIYLLKFVNWMVFHPKNIPPVTLLVHHSMGYPSWIGDYHNPFWEIPSEPVVQGTAREVLLLLPLQVSLSSEQRWNPRPGACCWSLTGWRCHFAKNKTHWYDIRMYIYIYTQYNTCLYIVCIHIHILIYSNTFWLCISTYICIYTYIYIHIYIYM